MTIFEKTIRNRDIKLTHIVLLSALLSGFVFLFGYEIGRVATFDEQEYQAGQLQGFRNCVRLTVRERTQTLKDCTP